MTIYISLLRGINVSGKNKIKMADLKLAYESLHFTAVSTYIQSGNIIFESTQKNLGNKIEKMINKEFDYTVSCILRTHTEWQNILIRNPFVARQGIDHEKLHVSLAKTDIDNKTISAFTETKNKNKNDELVFSGNEIYLYCPGGYGKTKFSNTFLEKYFAVPITTRNWKTVNKLNEIACNY